MLEGSIEKEIFMKEIQRMRGFFGAKKVISLHPKATRDWSRQILIQQIFAELVILYYYLMSEV